MKRIFLITLILLSLTGCNKEPKKEDSKTVKNNGMLSYTIDGEKTDIKPTKEDGYIVNKIICDNGSDMMWDNDNWEVELTKINSKDRCKIDFTKDITKEGYRVTVTSNNTSSLDSLSKATTENGTVKIYSKSTIKNVTGCDALIEDNKVIISNVVSNQTCNIDVQLKTLADTIKLAYNANDNRRRIDFKAIDNGTPEDTPTGLTGGLYTEEDNDGLTYYFSGDGTNMKNWVKFANKWWRIIRINGNGSVRLLYAGDGLDATDIGISSYNDTKNDPKYVGWKYGSETNGRGNTESTIYGVVNAWYTNLDSKTKTYLDMEAIYCNDREVSSGKTYSSSKYFDYVPYERLKLNSNNNRTPTFKCTNNSDRFTGKNSMAVGLITADEVAYAGGGNYTDNLKAYYYLAKDGASSITGDKWWWTMSAGFFSTGSTLGDGANVFKVRNSGGYTSGVVTGNSIVRPVISLKKETLVTSGDGSANAPYELTLE